MSNRQMIQWEPGTKPQRFSRCLDDVSFRINFDKSVNKKPKAKELKVDLLKEGDLVFIVSEGVVRRITAVSYERQQVMIYPFCYSFTAVKRVPAWVEWAQREMEKDWFKPEFDFRVEVVPVVLEPHPNADYLSIINCFGYPVVVQTKEFEGVDRAAYIPPGARILNEDPYYEWLGRDKRKVRVRKFRGVKSYGLVVPLKHNYRMGSDVQVFLDICHYKSTEPRNVK